ncbi:MAG: hypothetical protein M3015_03340 [Bacteroidota bacterium]|nr:hypothetical protein [Bacteroidota bacterium]
MPHNNQEEDHPAFSPGRAKFGSIQYKIAPEGSPGEAAFYSMLVVEKTPEDSFH